MRNEQNISYDTATIISVMQNIQNLIDSYQSQFNSRVNQGPLSLSQMADVLSHLPGLGDFPNQVSQWQGALNQHMNILSELCQIYQQGVQQLQSIDTNYGQHISVPDSAPQE